MAEAAALDGALPDAATLHLPATARLAFTDLRAVLAACVRFKECARIKPVDGPGLRKQRRDRAGEIGRVWTTEVPERFLFGKRLQAQDLLHAAIAVRGYDENGTGKAILRLNSEKQVVMKLPALPVI